MIDRMDINKKALLEALELYKGIVASACMAVGVQRQTFYNYVNNDPEFAQAVEEINEGAIDFVESKLLEKINGIKIVSKDVVYDQPPSDTAIIFYLKTKGKKRGYVERQELTGKDGEPLKTEPTVIHFS